METKMVLVGYHYFNTKNKYEHKRIKENGFLVPVNLKEKHEIADFVSSLMNGYANSIGSIQMVIIDYVEEINLVESN
jgi:hypothetical protein